MGGQGELFGAPARITAHCTECGREIVLSERRGKSLYSERQDMRGLCWGCALNRQIKKEERGNGDSK